MDPSNLLSDEGFARRLALGLLRDRAAAEDLVQEAWLEVLEHPPRHGGNLRGYLALILRRLRSRMLRGEARRSARHQARNAREPVPHTGELVARAEIHQRTVAAVLQLEEPYRSTVLLRFFQDLTPEEIAVRENVPTETVRTRLKRALTMLRARLEREGRDWREEWAVALGAGNWPGISPAPRSAPRALQSYGLIAGLAATVAIVWFARVRSDGEGEGPTDEIAAHDLGAHAPPELTPSPGPPEERAALESERAQPVAASGPTLAVRAVDAIGSSIPGVDVELSIQRFNGALVIASGTTDVAGRCECSLAEWKALAPPVRGLYLLYVNAWKTGFARYSAPVELDPDGMPRAAEFLIELVPGRLLHGRVIDATGAPACGANVEASIRRVDDPKQRRFDAQRTRRDGNFVVGLEPDEVLFDLLIRHTALGFSIRTEEDLAPITEIDLDLGDIALDPGLALRGRCMSPDGEPIAGLRIGATLAEPTPEGGFRKAGKRPRSELFTGLTNVTSRTAADGRFQLQGLRAGPFQLYTGVKQTLLDERVWDSGGPDIEIVYPYHRLAVEVLGPDGHAVGEARIAVTRVSATGEPLAAPSRYLTDSDEMPFAFVDVEPGERFAALAVVPGWASAEQIVEIPQRPFETRTQVHLGVEDRRATLELRPSSGSAAAWQVDLCSPLSGTPLPGFQDLMPDASGRVSGMMLGSFRVRVQPRPSTDDDALPRVCPSEASLPLVLGEGVTVLDFAVEPAARVRLVFTGKTRIPSHPQPDGRMVGQVLSPTIDPDDLDGAGTGRWDWLVGSLLPSRGSLELHVLRPDGERLLRRLTSLQPASNQRLDLVVPAAPLRLRVELAGLPPLERELAPAPGETLEIPILLDEIAPVR